MKQSDCNLENLSGQLGDLNMHFLFWSFIILLRKLMNIFSSLDIYEGEKWYTHLVVVFSIMDLRHFFETMTICFGPIVGTNLIIPEKKYMYPYMVLLRDCGSCLILSNPPKTQCSSPKGYGQNQGLSHDAFIGNT